MAQRSKPEYEGEPTLGQVMRKPFWIFALLLALLVAAGFAWLGQWQMSSAIRHDATQQTDTETPRPLQSVTSPGKPVTEASGGMMVTARGAFTSDPLLLVAPRENHGMSGVWIVGHFQQLSDVTVSGPSLAVALAWAPDMRSAEQAAQRMSADAQLRQTRELLGRYMPADGAQIPDPAENPHAVHTMLPGYFMNLWHDVSGGIYTGYLVAHNAGDIAAAAAEKPLEAIVSEAPLPAETVNWLNVFYAIEWAVFAGFAVFLWFRLARDAWEKEHEIRLMLAAQEHEESSPMQRTQ